MNYKDRLSKGKEADKKKIKLQKRLMTRISIYNEKLLFGKEKVEILKLELCEDILDIFL
ncbi:MAG: hypothetical protein GW938_17210 [Leptospira sp.]|nr:hypothetical protein [Leptospira sp.]